MRNSVRTLGRAVVLLLLSAGCESGNEFVPPPPPTVTVAPPSQRDVTVYEEFPGRAEAVDTVDLRARVQGFLRSVEFEEGLRVKEGDLLFTIESEPFQATVAAMEASLAKAQSERDLAQATLERRREAFQKQAISEIDFLIAQAEMQGAEANILLAKANLEKAKLDLSYTEIHAPATGRISRKLVSVGNLVGGPEATLLATLVVEDPIYVLFTVDERSLIPRAMERDRDVENPATVLPPVKLELADGTIYPEEGRIDYADPSLDPETGTLTVRAVFENADAKLVPGLYAKILVPDERAGAILVPDTCIQRDLAGPFVLVVDGEGKVDSRYVTPGARVSGDRIIEEGLEPTDRVVVKGIQRARPGIAVQVVEPSEDSEATAGGAPAGK